MVYLVILMQAERGMHSVESLQGQLRSALIVDQLRQQLKLHRFLSGRVAEIWEAQTLQPGCQEPFTRDLTLVAFLLHVAAVQSSAMKSPLATEPGLICVLNSM